MARRQIPPSELDICEGSVFANTLIPKGTKYGTFLGQWTAQPPQNEQYAWEVSLFL